MTSTIERDIFIPPEGEENGHPALNTEALHALGLWVMADDRAAKKVTAWIDRVWNQDVWASDNVDYDRPTMGEWMGALDAIAPACGAAFCVAGNAVASSTTHRLLWDRVGGATRAIRITPTGETDRRGKPLYRDVPGAIEDIDDAARTMLGLTGPESNHLFADSNSAEYICARINGCCRDRGLPILFPDYAPFVGAFWEWEDEMNQDHEPVL